MSDLVTQNVEGQIDISPLAIARLASHAVDLYIIIEYGTRISTVASSVINAVRFYVEKATGLAVMQIHVHVQGVHVSEDPKVNN